MNTEKYLQELLNSQNLSSQQEKDLESHKEEVTKFLRKEFGIDPVIKYAGSHEKGTMICDSYDLDIVCYFPSGDPRSIKDIRQEVAMRLDKEYQLKHKTSAERILDLKGIAAPSDFHIDVVPGKFIADTKDVFINIMDGEKDYMKTNLKTHIDHIKNSGCVPVIRLVKLWANRNNIQMKTFVLELFVIEILSGSQSKSDLKKSFLKVMEGFKDKFVSMQITDPANPYGNIVSTLVSESDKQAVKAMAEKTFKSINGSDDLVVWQAAFPESTKSMKTFAGATSAAVAATAYSAGSSFKPTSQWGC